MAGRKLEIISQGEEIVLGDLVDENAAEIAAAAVRWGLIPTRHVTVGDSPADIAAALVESMARADEVISTGGLGPTEDDCTAEAVALALGVPLREDPVALAQVIERYAAMGRSLDGPGRRQARIPDGARVLENRWGTAPGFAVSGGRARAWFLPGVPWEMRGMLGEHLAPELGGGEAPPVSVVRTMWLPESRAQGLLAGLSDPDIHLGFRAMTAGVDVRLRGRPGMAEERLWELRRRVITRLGASVYGVDSGPIEEVVGGLLAEAGATVAVAESCTGGRLAAAFTGTPGSSTWFLEGAVTYSDEAKVRALGVEQDLILAHGPVSADVATAMAEGIRHRSGATYGISTTGVAGPGGGSPENPVGTIYVALSGPSGGQVERLTLSGEREQVMERTVSRALDLLRRALVS